MTTQVLFLYATTYPVCRANLPLWRDLSRRLGARAVQVYGVSLDSAAVTQRFAVDDTLAFPSALLSDTRSAGLLRAFAVPQALVVGSDGRVLYSRQGVLSGAAVDSVIAASTSEAPTRR